MTPFGTIPDGPPPEPQQRPGPRLRPWHVIVAGTVALAIVAGGGLAFVALLFAQGNPALSESVVAVANEALGTDSTRLAADRVSGRLFGAAELLRPRLLVRTRDGEVTWASAERMRIEYDLFRLLFGNRRALRVQVSAPRVALTHDRAGNLVVPRFATRPRRGPSQLVTQVDVTFRDGVFTLDRGGARFQAISGALTARVESGRTTLIVRRLTGTSGMAGRPGAVRAEGRAVVVGRSMRIEPLSIALDSTRADVSVEWDLAGARVVASTVRFSPLDLDEAMRLLDLAPVTRGTLRGEATFAGDPTSGSARVRLAGTIAGEPVDTLSASATMVPGAIRVEDLGARFRGAKVRGRGIYETRGVLRADLELADVDPAALPWFRASRSAPRGSLNARVALTARRSRPSPTAEIGITFLPGRIGRVAIEGGRARLRQARDGSIAVDSAWIDLPGGRVLSKGTIAADRTLALHLDGTIRDLGRMNDILRPVAVDAGSGRAEAEIWGAPAAPEFLFRAAVINGTLRNGVRFDTLRVDARGVLGRDVSAQGEARAVGLGAGARALGDGVAALAYGGGGLSVRRYRQTLGDTTLALSGRVSFLGPRARALLDSVTFIVGTRVWRNDGTVDATLEGDRIHVTTLRLGLESGSLDLAGDLWVREARIAARGSLRGVDLARALAPRDTTRRYGGIASVEFEASGSLRDPDVSAAVVVLQPRLRGLSGDSLTVRLHYEPGQLLLEEARLTAGPGRLELTGRAEPRLRLEDWVRSLARGEDGWAPLVPLAMQLSVDSLPLERIRPLAANLQTLSGAATLRASVSGTAAAPILRIQGHGTTMAYRGIGLEAIDVEGTYEDRRLTVTSMRLRQGHAVSNIQGHVPVDLSLTAKRRSVPGDSMQFAVRMTEADFSVAALFVSQIAASSGKLTLLADVSGTPDHPRVQGSVRLTEGTVRFAGREEVLEDVQIEGTISEGRLNATRILAREGKRGTLKGSGWWRWVAGTPLGEYDLAIHAQDFTATDRQTYNLRFTGDFSIRNGRARGGAPLPLITGTAFVSRGELTWIQEPTAPQERPPTPFLYEVALEVPRNLWFRNLDTEVELGGRLVVKNEGPRDVILGDLDVLRGRYYVCYAKFQVTSGTISFHNVDTIDPEIAIDAEVRLPGRHTGAASGEKDRIIKMALAGRSSQLKITPYDDLGKNPSSLWKELCIGQVSSAGSEPFVGIEPTAGAGLDPGAADVTLPIRDFLFRNVERWLGDVGLIDTIDLKSGEVTTRTTAGAPTIGSVGVGKYVTPELYLRYSRGFSGTTAEQKISAEYRVTRHLLLKGEQAQRPAQRDQYNLDLKIRFEY